MRHLIAMAAVVVALGLVGPACMGEVTPERGPELAESVAEVENALGNLDGEREPAIPNAGATGSYKTCADMYNDCQDIGGRCKKGYPGCDRFGQSSCGTCYQACQAGSSYPKACRCHSCGFE